MAKIKEVGVEVKELRSTGYPNFCNKTFGVYYLAELAEGESADAIKRELLNRAVTDVKRLHGDLSQNQSVQIKIIEQTEIDF